MTHRFNLGKNGALEADDHLGGILVGIFDTVMEEDSSISLGTITKGFLDGYRLGKEEAEKKIGFLVESKFENLRSASDPHKTKEKEDLVLVCRGCGRDRYTVVHTKKGCSRCMEGDDVVPKGFSIWVIGEKKGRCSGDGQL